MGMIVVLVVFVTAFTWLGNRVGYDTGWRRGFDAGVASAHRDIEDMRTRVNEWDAI